MTKDVLVSISGLQIDVQAYGMEDAEPIEVVTPASYYFKNNKHYILYDEMTEGIHDVTKNRIKIIGNEVLEIMKIGVYNAHMIFEKSKKNLTYYQTPYGQMLVGVDTKSLDVSVTEKNIDVRVDYELDINHAPLANCTIRMNITPKTGGDFSMMS